MQCDVLIIGGGASGLMAAIAAARQGIRVLVCEHSSRPGAKILASGGGRCNISNTLPPLEFMAAFGRNGRFMEPALALMGREALQRFMAEIGVETHCPDGKRIWPVDHSAKIVQRRLVDEAKKLGVRLLLCQRVSQIVPREDATFAVTVGAEEHAARTVIVATGGLSYPGLGATADGYKFAAAMGHEVAQTVPAGVPLVSREGWTARLTADTVGKATVRVAIKKHALLMGEGDLIFTRTGIAGPVVLDLSGKIAALLQKYDEVPVLLHLTRGRSQQDWQDIFKRWQQGGLGGEPLSSLLVEEGVAVSVAQVLCEMADADSQASLRKIPRARLGNLCKLLAETPLTIVGTAGYDHAFVTKGGVSLKGVHSKTLESKRQKGLYFCGEVLDLDGPCGGFNLQWAFASGYLAGCSAASACS